MRSRQKRIAIAAVAIVLLVSALSAVFATLLNDSPQNPGALGQYLSVNGVESKIALINRSFSFILSNETYASADGKQTAQGCVYTINLTLRNDYSSDNPPPSLTGNPVAPVDGTAYMRLKASLLANGTAVPVVNLSSSDFAPTAEDQNGIVLASGEAKLVEIVLAADQTNLEDYSLTLVSVSDSIT